MLTLKEMHHFINTEMEWIIKLRQDAKASVINTLYVRVKVLDVKCAWGQYRCKVTPIHGSGETWLNFHKQLQPITIPEGLKDLL